MSGLDKILNTIEEQGNKNVQAIIKSADDSAAKIKADGEAQAKLEYDKYIEKCIKTCKREYENACSSVQAGTKRELLSCKIECVNLAIQNALNKLSTLPDDEYFEFVITLARKNLHKGKGVISFCERDLKRLPADFITQINSISQDCVVELSPQAADIKNGFILSWGDISENCSFKDIAESEKDRLKDMVAKVLFY